MTQAERMDGFWPTRQGELIFVITVLTGSILLLVGDAYVRGSQTMFWITLGSAAVTSELINRYFYRRHIEKIFGAREVLDVDTIYSRFYSQSGISREQFAEVWSAMEERSDAPAGKMRPSDRFGVEIDGFHHLTDDLDAMAWFARKLEKKAGRTFPMSEWNTVDDMVRGICS